MKKKTRRTLVSISISAIVCVLLFRVIDWGDASQLIKYDFAPEYIAAFVILSYVTLTVYGYRWQLLLNKRLDFGNAVLTSVVSLGGNMFLPAHGGDLLRVHHSHLVSGMPHAMLMSRLFLEKIVDLVSIALVGAVAMATLPEKSASTASSTLSGATWLMLLAVFVAIVLLKMRAEMVVRLLDRLFRFANRSAFFERHVAHLIRDASANLTVKALLPSLGITCAMWFATYTVLYMTGARMVGCQLSYTEALFVVYIGTLGLMVPAAPSGIGTFHASVVSAFSVLGRSASEGLVVATMIHILLLVVYGLPVALAYAAWRIRARPARH